MKVQLRLFARNRLSFVFRVENFDPNDTSAVAEARLKPHEDAPEEDDDEDDVDRRHDGGLIDKLKGFFECYYACWNLLIVYLQLVESVGNVLLVLSEIQAPTFENTVHIIQPVDGGAK